MAKLFKRWKKDGIFRRNVIIGLVLIFFLSGNFGEPQQQAVSQSQCDTYNTGQLIGQGNYINSKADATDCQAITCKIQYNINPDSWGVVSALPSWAVWISEKIGSSEGFTTCKDLVDTGKWVLTNDQAPANNACKSGNAVKVVNNWLGDNIYRCSASLEGNSCKVWEKPFAGVIDSIWKKNDIKDCGTKAYMVLGMGVLLLVAVI